MLPCQRQTTPECCGLLKSTVAPHLWKRYSLPCDVNKAERSQLKTTCGPHSIECARRVFASLKEASMMLPFDDLASHDQITEDELFPSHSKPLEY